MSLPPYDYKEKGRLLQCSAVYSLDNTVSSGLYRRKEWVKLTSIAMCPKNHVLELVVGQGQYVSTLKCGDYNLLIILHVETNIKVVPIICGVLVA